MPLELPEDLSWLAFQYVSGALDETALNRFEARLATDQSAREAVAEAVGLIEELNAVAPRASGADQRAPLRLIPRRAAILAAAASVALGLTFGTVWLSRGRPANPVAAPAPGTVALAWSGLQSADPTYSADSRDLPDEILSWLNDPNNGDPPLPDPPDEDESLPSWLLEAVVLREGS